MTAFADQRGLHLAPVVEAATVCKLPCLRTYKPLPFLLKPQHGCLSFKQRQTKSARAGHAGLLARACEHQYCAAIEMQTGNQIAREALREKRIGNLIPSLVARGIRQRVSAIAQCEERVLAHSSASTLEAPIPRRRADAGMMCILSMRYQHRDDWAVRLIAAHASDVLHLNRHRHENVLAYKISRNSSFCSASTGRGRQETCVQSFQDHQRLDVIEHGPRLNEVAAAQTKDVNAARLIVHGVLARAMDDDVSPVSADALDLALMHALAARPSESSCAAPLSQGTIR